ncbi:hypothetical protein GCM10020221_21710 [Streptomyces thioluteus]|uniref:ABC transporter ATP-binding protein n=1 Tax=Streptomyces thioluteus TaxID=66431 RepID=A0ABN3WT87_STRTU
MPLLQITVLAVAGVLLSRGRISVGDLLAASRYAVLATGVGMLNGRIGALVRARAAGRRIAEVLAVPAVRHGTLRLPPGPGTLELRGVGAVRGGRPVLDGVDLVVPGGTSLAVVGRSGSGKSVLAALAGRLADPDSGTVALDGVPLPDLSHDELRRAVGHAFERPALLGATVGDALAFGVFDPGREAVTAAARARVRGRVRPAAARGVRHAAHGRAAVRRRGPTPRPRPGVRPRGTRPRPRRRDVRPRLPHRAGGRPGPRARRRRPHPGHRRPPRLHRRPRRPGRLARRRPACAPRAHTPSCGGCRSTGRCSVLSELLPELPSAGLRFLAARRGALARLAGWSALEAAPHLRPGLRPGARPGRGVPRRPDRRGGWPGWPPRALAVLAGAYGTGRTYPALATVVEPLRDALVRRVVARALDDGDGAAVSRLTHQVEIARDAFAGLLMVTRSFVFTATGALTGLFLLAPALLPVVAGPLVLGLALFAATLRVLARRQEAFLVADEEIARALGEVCEGVRDVAAGGAGARVRSEVGALVDAQRAVAGSLARWSVARVAALTVAGRLPVVLLLVSAPWLLDRGVTAGALVGALAYLTQSLLPALQDLVRGVGTSGARLTVVLRRLALATPALSPFPTGAAAPAPPRDAPAAPGPALRTEGGASPPHPPDLTFHHLTFAYGPHAAPVVHDLTLTIPPGGHLAVVGPSGVGKSTLAGLAAGLLAPSAGSVSLGGAPAHSDAARALRLLIPQEAYVFSGTLAENLGYLRQTRPPRGRVGGRRPRHRHGTARRAARRLRHPHRPGGALRRRTPADRTGPRLPLPRPDRPARRGDVPPRPGRRGTRRARPRPAAGRRRRRRRPRHAGRHRAPRRLRTARGPDPGDGRAAHGVRGARRTPARLPAVPRPHGRRGRRGGRDVVTPSPRPARSLSRRPDCAPLSCG